MPFINLKTCHLRYKGLIFTSREILFNSERQSLTPSWAAIVLKSPFYHHTTLLPRLSTWLSRSCKTSCVIVHCWSLFTWTTFELISGSDRNFYLAFATSAPCKLCLEEWASQLNNLQKLVLPAAPLWSRHTESHTDWKSSSTDCDFTGDGVYGKDNISLLSGSVSNLFSPLWFVQILEEEDRFKETEALTFQDLYKKHTL